MKENINKISNTLYDLFTSLFILAIVIANSLDYVQLPNYLNNMLSCVVTFGFVEAITKILINIKKDKK